MSKNIEHLQHIKSNVVTNGKPKLPDVNALVEGELAINYANGYETMSIKNSNSAITTFSSDAYYTRNKLGNRFTSDTTVTSVIDNIYATKSNLHVGTFNANDITEEGWYDAIVLGRPEGSESDEKYLLYHSSNGGQICFSRRNSGKCYQRLGIGHPWMPIAEDDYSLMQSSSAAINNYELSSSFGYADWTPLISEGYRKDDNTRLSEIYAGDTLSVTEAHLIKTVHLHPNDIIRVRVLYRRGFAYEIENYKYDSDAYVYVSNSQNAGHTINVLKSDFIKVKSLGSLDYVMPSWQDLAFVRDELFTDNKEYGWLYLKTNAEQEGDYYLHIHGDFSLNGSWLLFGEGEVWTPCKYSFEELVNNKLGSGFTGVNSAITVTNAIDEIKEQIGSGFTVSSITNVIEENEEIVSTSLNSLNENLSAHTSDSTRHIKNGGEVIYNLVNPTGEAGGTNKMASWSGHCEGITELYDGMNVQIKIPVAGYASGDTLSINGGERHRVLLNASSNLTTNYPSGAIIRLVYDANQSANVQTGSSTAISVQGVWKISDYNTNTDTLGYQIRTNSSTLPVSDATYRYRLLFTSADGSHWVPANTSTNTGAIAIRDVNQRPINPFGSIAIYNATTALSAGANVSTTHQFQQTTLVLGYSFNGTGAALTLSYPAPVYIKATPQSDGSAIIDETTPYVQALPTTEDGKIYIFLGIAYDATHVEMRLEHPIYWFKGGKITQYTGVNDTAYMNVDTELTPSSSSNSLVTAKAVYDAVFSIEEQMEVISSALNDLNKRLMKLEN